jgi:hypothetical protein
MQFPEEDPIWSRNRFRTIFYHSRTAHVRNPKANMCVIKNSTGNILKESKPKRCP